MPRLLSRCKDVTPKRVPGTPLDFHFEPATHTLRVRYITLPAEVAPLELALPVGLHYPQGFDVDSTDPPGSWGSSFDPALNVLTVTHSSAVADHEVVVRPR